MNISAQTIIAKLKKETGTLSMGKSNSASMYGAMQRIHLLSELWLESYQGEPTQQPTKPTTQVDMQPPELLEKDSTNTEVSDEDTSIFDF